MGIPISGPTRKAGLEACLTAALLGRGMLSRQVGPDMGDRQREQKLVDIMFEIALGVHASQTLQNLSREQLAEWVAKQLRECGFDTQPMGMSWGRLT